MAENVTHGMHCPVTACPSNPIGRKWLCGYVTALVPCAHWRYRDEFEVALEPYRAMAGFLRGLMTHEEAHYVK